MSGKLHALATFTQAENARYFLNRKLVRPQGWSDVLEKRNIFFFFWNSEYGSSHIEPIS